MAAGDITDLLVDELGLRLEDSDEVVFTPEIKLKALNRAQLRLANMLHDAYLTEFESESTALSISTGYILLSALNSGLGILRGGEGIISVTVAPGGTGSVIANRVDKKDLKKVENAYLTYSNDHPLFYVFNSKVYVLLTTLTASTAIFGFLKVPTDMSTNIDPTLNASLHDVMINFAESICWGIDNKHDRKNSALEIALAEVKILNERYEPKQLGTNNRRK